MIFNKKNILITGVCGTVGSELLHQLLTSNDYDVQEVVGLDHNESGIFHIDQIHLKDSRAKFFIADCRDLNAMYQYMKNIDIVFHVAALKHVILCERSPDQAVLTNIDGVQNIINAAKYNNVERVIFTSSDKAVNPTNVMGTSKLMGERLITAANSTRKGTGPVFASTRFGNVLGSKGSVVPILHNQIAKGGPVTVTDPEMTRFVMSIQEAVSLVIKSAEIALGGEVFVTKMPVVNIADLADAMIQEIAPLYNRDPESINKEIIGIKPGEKLYEELMSEEETKRSIELDDFFSVLPAFRGIYHEIDYKYSSKTQGIVDNPYVSASLERLSIQDIQTLLHCYGLLHSPNDSADRRYWPGDKESNQ